MVVAVLPGCASHSLRFEDLCAPLRPKLYARAMQLSRDPQTAQDLVQDTLLKAFLSWSRFTVQSGQDPAECALVWLQRILRNTFLSLYRTNRFYATVLESYREEISSTSTARFEAPSESVSGEVLAAVDSLGGYRREVVRRMDLGGQTYEEVSLAIGVNVRTLKSGRSRAHRKLATVLRLAPGRPTTANKRTVPT